MFKTLSTSHSCWQNNCYTQCKSLQSVSTWAIGTCIHCHLIHEHAYGRKCIQLVKTLTTLAFVYRNVKIHKFWWMLSYHSCSQEVSVKVIWLILLLLLVLLVPPSSTTQSGSLSALPTFSRTPLKCHLLQIVSLQHVCVSVSTIKPPEFRSTLVSSSSCLTRV